MPEVFGDGPLTPEEVARYWRLGREEATSLFLDGKHEEASSQLERMIAVSEDGQAYQADGSLEDFEPQLSAEQFAEAYRKGRLLWAVLRLDEIEGRKSSMKPEYITTKLWRSFARCEGYWV